MRSVMGAPGRWGGRSAVGRQDDGAVRDRRSAGDEHVVDGLGGLVDGGAADQPDALGNPVDPVDVALTQLAPVRVDREAAVELQVACGDEVLGLAAAAE